MCSFDPSLWWVLNSKLCCDYFFRASYISHFHITQNSPCVPRGTIDNIIETLQVPLILRPPAVAPGHKTMGILSLLPVPTIGRCPRRKGASGGSTPPWSFPLQSPPPVHITSAPPGVFPQTVVSYRVFYLFSERGWPVLSPIPTWNLMLGSGSQQLCGSL